MTTPDPNFAVSLAVIEPSAEEKKAIAGMKFPTAAETDARVAKLEAEALAARKREEEIAAFFSPVPPAVAQALLELKKLRQA